ncbi:MAG: LTA synthase family protein [Clostridia bacterium]|nr:LTA synthase family protein [Clostridia bacterium]
MDVKEKTEDVTAENTPVRKKPGVVVTVILAILFFIGTVLLVGTIWYNNTFKVGFKELLYTMISPLKGTESGFIIDALKICIPPIIIIFAIYLAVFLKARSCEAKKSCAHRQTGEKKEGKKRKIGKPTCSFVRKVCVVLSVLLFVGALIFALASLKVFSYLKSISDTTTIYEDRYVKPSSDIITADGKTKNLIYIYLESMETTYASTEAGGRQEINYIEGLTELVNSDGALTFTDKEAGVLGGFHNPTGTGWTMGSLLATTSGVPFSFPVERNSMNKRETFAPGLVNLGDILAEKGYNQEFLCGSDADFAGRKSYFTQHGNYKIFDLYSARREGYIAKDYKVWWGYEDEILYKIAKDELIKLSSEDKPFNFTMLTVDTHHVNGYVCNLCDNKYDTITANVVACADRQVTDFVEWLRQQDFYENTVVIISGDHPRMDTNLVEDVDFYDRTVYNCILNTDTVPAGKTTERVFTPMDMFPTILEAMGFDVEGDRLGLGTSLFSTLPTLAEEMGYDAFNAEVSKYSPYYVETFSR